jgi:hypothetical protein
MTSLTNDQKEKAISLFVAGVTHYTEISKKLRVPYRSVNSFMTKWQESEGILKHRNTANKIPEKFTATPDTKIDILNKAVLEELKFLREFYLHHVLTNRVAPSH